MQFCGITTRKLALLRPLEFIPPQVEAAETDRSKV